MDLTKDFPSIIMKIIELLSKTPALAAAFPGVFAPAGTAMEWASPGKRDRACSCYENGRNRGTAKNLVVIA